MGILIKVDFKNRREVKEFASYNETNLAPKIQTGPLEQEFIKRLDLNTLKYVSSSIYDNIAARFGSEQPRGGVMYKDVGQLVKGVYYIDSYGRGCTSNALGNPYKKDLEDKALWNRPIPFPVDIAGVFQNVGKLLVNDTEIKKFRLGIKNDPLAWLDQKYNISKELINYFNGLRIPYEIFTMSDLVAHDDYIKLLDKKLCTVIMHMPETVTKDELVKNDTLQKFHLTSGLGFDGPRNYHEITEDLLRRIEPGAPSLKRRNLAVEKLVNAGITVKVDKSFTWDKIRGLK